MNKDDNYTEKERAVNYERKTGRQPLTPEEWHKKMRKKHEKLEKPLPDETLTSVEWKEKEREERERAKKRLPDETDIYEA